MGFIDTLLLWDTHLFLIINGFHNAFFDKFMFIFSDKLVWIPFYLAVIFEILNSKKKESVWLILALVLCVVLSDQISSSLIKDTVQRLRPSQDESLLNITHIVNVYKGGKFGFVSSHAANTFGFALLSSLIFRNRLYTFIVFSWAVLSAYSRIYLGVHYPGDVLGGMMVGGAVALICFGILKRYKTLFINNFSVSFANVFTISSLVMLMSILSIAIYSLII
ncbi:MAG TPA: phosphatase PAP2 family protein [Paludibacter sp.]|nr:phosphatase PAP2 family protein [Paludibacter sp.]